MRWAIRAFTFKGFLDSIIFDKDLPPFDPDKVPGASKDRFGNWIPCDQILPLKRGNLDENGSIEKWCYRDWGFQKLIYPISDLVSDLARRKKTERCWARLLGDLNWKNPGKVYDWFFGRGLSWDQYKKRIEERGPWNIDTLDQTMYFRLLWYSEAEINKRKILEYPSDFGFYNTFSNEEEIFWADSLEPVINKEDKAEAERLSVKNPCGHWKKEKETPYDDFLWPVPFYLKSCLDKQFDSRLESKTESVEDFARKFSIVRREKSSPLQSLYGIPKDESTRANPSFKILPGNLSRLPKFSPDAFKWIYLPEKKGTSKIKKGWKIAGDTITSKEEDWIKYVGYRMWQRKVDYFPEKINIWSKKKDFTKKSEKKKITDPPIYDLDEWYWIKTQKKASGRNWIEELFERTYDAKYHSDIDILQGTWGIWFEYILVLEPDKNGKMVKKKRPRARFNIEFNEIEKELIRQIWKGPNLPRKNIAKYLAEKTEFPKRTVYNWLGEIRKKIKPYWRKPPRIEKYTLRQLAEKIPLWKKEFNSLYRQQEQKRGHDTQPSNTLGHKIQEIRNKEKELRGKGETFFEHFSWVDAREAKKRRDAEGFNKQSILEIVQDYYSWATWYEFYDSINDPRAEKILESWFDLRTLSFFCCLLFDKGNLLGPYMKNYKDVIKVEFDRHSRLRKKDIYVGFSEEKQEEDSSEEEETREEETRGGIPYFFKSSDGKRNPWHVVSAACYVITEAAHFLRNNSHLFLLFKNKSAIFRTYFHHSQSPFQDHLKKVREQKKKTFRDLEFSVEDTRETPSTEEIMSLDTFEATAREDEDLSMDTGQADNLEEEPGLEPE